MENASWMTSQNVKMDGNVLFHNVEIDVGIHDALQIKTVIKIVEVASLR